MQLHMPHMLNAYKYPKEKRVIKQNKTTPKSPARLYYDTRVSSFQK